MYAGGSHSPSIIQATKKRKAGVRANVFTPRNELKRKKKVSMYVCILVLLLVIVFLCVRVIIRIIILVTGPSSFEGRTDHS